MPCYCKMQPEHLSTLFDTDLLCFSSNFFLKLFQPQAYVSAYQSVDKYNKTNQST